MKIFILFVISCFCFSCTNHYSQEIEGVLQQAGSNRKELEQVLKHYSQDSADSLKLRAAEFLIVNMPGKYSKYYDAPWNDVAAVSQRWTSSSNKRMVLDTYKLGNMIVEEDVKHITAGYLINNIDLAFKVWQEQPWGKHVSFDTFCEEILPYRVSAEPLENWREKALASFANLNRSLQEQPDITAVEACSKVNDALPQFRLDPDFPSMNYSMLMASTRGTCDDISAFAVFVMRALGIPVTIDYTPQWPKSNVGHSWNSVCDSSGRHISFMGTESNPGRPHRGTWKTKSIVYRQTFANRKYINTGDENIPPELQNHNVMNVSPEYEGSTDVEMPVRYPPAVNTGYAYLATWGRRLYTVAYGTTDGQTLRFASVFKNVLYMPIFYVNGKQSAAQNPFSVDEKGAIHLYEADTAHLQPLTLHEMYMADDPWTQRRMHRGVFEGAGRPDFSDAIPLYTIADMPEASFNTVKLKRPVSCRYVRYVSPPESHCYVGEIRFYATNGQLLHGTSIGTPGAYNNSSNTCDKAFDDDLNTFYDAAESSGAWTGLDLGKKQNIGEIHYYPQNNGNSITIHRYELFYWEGAGWKLLGRQQGTGYPLNFQVPSNALLYLKDVSTNENTEHVFTVSDGKPEWF